MTAKEYLRQYQDAEREIRSKLDEIKRLRALAEKTTQALQSDKVQTSDENRFERTVTALADLEKEAEDAIYRLSDIKHQVKTAIATVPDPLQRAVLTRRYINGETWEQIAIDINKSYQWVCELHGRGLQNISQELIEIDTRPVI